MISTNWIVITDLDGTLMDHEYDYSPAIETINWLKLNNIPIIPCTSKTAAEVRKFRNDIGINSPYIVENGGAVYGEKSDNSGEEWILQLSKSSKQLRKILFSISSDIKYNLQPFSEMSKDKIFELTGLDSKSIDLASKREWSVPFLNPPINYMNKMLYLRDKYSVDLFQGNLMCHLVSSGCSKGNAINELKKYLKIPKCRVIGLGDSPNDLPLLNVSDIGVVVPGKNGPHKLFDEATCNIAPPSFT